MKRIIIAFAVISTFSLGCLCCGGSGQRQMKAVPIAKSDEKAGDNVKTMETPVEDKQKPKSQTLEKPILVQPIQEVKTSDEDLQTIAIAEKKRTEALALKKQILESNAVMRKRYEAEITKYNELFAKYQAELGKFKTDLNEFKAARDLEGSRIFKTDMAKEKRYREIIREYPSTDAAKEARNRLAGLPSSKMTNTEPIKPKEPESPISPRYQAAPSIPEVPTIATLQKAREEDRLKREAESVKARTVDAPTLVHNYKLNEIASDARWRDRKIVVTGSIAKVQRSLSGDAYVIISGKNQPWVVQCFFASDREQQLTALQPGQQVEIEGRCRGRGTIINVILDDCEVK